MARLGKEDEYFLAQELAQRIKLRNSFEAKAKAAAEQRTIAQSVGVSDELLVERIHNLGFDGATAEVLHLMPLVEVAWADGTLSAGERRVILRAAETAGIAPHSPGGLFLAAILEERPSDTVLDEVMALLKDVLHAKGAHPGSVLEACVDVAAASGGFLGLGSKISDAERATIKEIAATFGDAAKQEVSKRLG